MDNIHNRTQLKICYQLISKISEIQREDLQGCIMTSAKFVCGVKREYKNYQVRIEHENEKRDDYIGTGNG